VHSRCPNEGVSVCVDPGEHVAIRLGMSIHRSVLSTLAS
jgi:hypothetical protein